MPKKSGLQRPLAMLSAAVAAFSIPRVGLSQTTDWTNAAGDGSWINPANWDNGVPQGEINVNVTSTLGLSQTVNYNYTGTATTLGTLTVNLSGASSSADETLSISGNTLSTINENVGGYGGTISGQGAILQSGGSNSSDYLDLGNQATSTGNYVLSGSATLQCNTETVGNVGVGVFNQAGGVNTVETLDLGNGAASNGTYNLSGGTLSAVDITYSSNGSFTQTGGTLVCQYVNQTGGSLVAGTPGSLVPTPLVLASGTASVGFLLSGGTLSSATINVNPGGFFEMTGGSLNCGSFNVNDGYASFSVVSLDSGGVAPVFNTPSGVAPPTFSISSGTIAATDAYLGLQPGPVSFTPPTAYGFSPNNLYIGYAAGSTATFTLSTGTLQPTNEYLGYGGSGTLTQTGGRNDPQTLYFGGGSNSSATYNIEGGTLSPLVINYSTGTLVQTGGTFQCQNFIQSGGNLTAGAANSLFPNPLGLGFGGSDNSYLLTAGTLTCATINVGVDGIFNMTGGALACTTFNLTGGTAGFPTVLLDSGKFVPSFGIPTGTAAPTITLSSGTLIAVNSYLGSSPGTSSFTLSSTTLVFVPSNLYVGFAAGSNARITLITTLTGTSEYVGYNGSGTFIQSGGTNQLPGFDKGNGSLFLGYNSGSTGSYLLNPGGTLTLYGNSSESVGYGGIGIFNQTGGTNNASVLAVGSQLGSTGTYTISGGTAAVTDAYIGGSVNGAGGKGTLVLDSGGSLAIAGTLTAYNTSGTSIQLNGGSLYAGSLDFNGTPSLLNWIKGTLSLPTVTFDSGAAPTSTGAAFGSAPTIGANQVLSAGGEIVGDTGSFSFAITGGGVNAAGGIVLGNHSGAVGTLTLSGSGSVVSGSVMVGQNGVGFFNQSGGTNNNDVNFGTDIAEGVGSVGTYILSNGELGAVVIIGDQGTGYLVQTGGTDIANLALGNSATGIGTYSLSGTGAISSNSEIIGDSGVGIFNQSGGTNKAGLFTVGNNIGSTGTYLLSGTGSLAVTGSQGVEFVGLSGVGIFNQSGGTNTIGGYNTLYLGEGIGSTGTYILSGTGTLSANFGVIVGFHNNAGILDQTGGTLSVVNGLNIGANGVATIDGGSSTVDFLGLSGDLYVGSAGHLVITDDLTQYGGSTTVSGTLTLNSGQFAIDSGAVDLAGGTIVLNAFGNADPVAQVLSYLQTGYNGGAWNGPGINSSTVATLNGQRGLVYALGFADGADGLTALSSGEIEIIPTLAGDATLQGTVNFGDFQLIAEYFGKSGTSWDEGDFTYNGTTNFGDFQLLAQDFGSANSALTASQFASLNSFAAQFGDALVANADGVGFQVVSVPEPASVGMMAIAGLAGLGRRQRRTN